ncbi:MAG: hypothetical protein C0598_01860 [Marinilabiliales bacterium]|nr:MAG: hypothetical protein C0598_01860 [Marinilabiliales bacterium]
MKKTTVFIFLILFIGIGSSFSQQFHGGITAGLSASQVAGDSYSGYNKAGLFFGGYVSLDITEKSMLQMELTYFQKGSRVNPDSTNNYNQYKFRANYIELPVFYKYKAGKFRIFAGPSMGFLIGHYEEADYQQIDITPNYNKPASLTLQLNLGMGFYITEKLGAEIRTNNSILNIRSRNATGDVFRFWTYGQFHDVLVISLFYRIR